MTAVSMFLTTVAVAFLVLVALLAFGMAIGARRRLRRTAFDYQVGLDPLVPAAVGVLCLFVAFLVVVASALKVLLS